MFMNKTTIFYSWQTDQPTKENKFFIKSALEKAISELNSEFKIEDSARPDIELDHDTKNVPGTPPIVESILSKIAKCDIFVADLTYVAQVPGKHGVSNPNVLMERGYALSKIGHERMLAVMNEAHGLVDKLPFDLKGIRWPIRYMLHGDANKKARLTQEKVLISQLKQAIITILNSQVITTNAPDPITILKENIHNPQEIIKIHDIVKNAVDLACQQLKTEKFSLSDSNITIESSWDRISEYEKILSSLINIIITGCHWGNTDTLNIWQDIVYRIGTVAAYKQNSFYTHWKALALYPALILFYAGGLAALKNKKYETLFRLFTIHIKMEGENYQQPITDISSAYLPLEKKERRFQQINYGSKRLHDTLRLPLKQYIQIDKEYDHYFGLFELIYNIIFIYHRKKEGVKHHHVFCDLNFPSLKSHDAIHDFLSDINHHKNSHWLIKNGFFDGNFENIIQALETLNNITDRVHAI